MENGLTQHEHLNEDRLAKILFISIWSLCVSELRANFDSLCRWCMNHRPKWARHWKIHCIIARRICLEWL